ncbi:MAG: cystathionine beta-synthase, partial [Rhodospirillales bacterium]|nr:cystathionine beta-synthase [Rhodospirillales bacterium]
PFRNVLETIGNTPLIEATRLDAGPCQLFLKLESQNPGGSIKDRMALSMVEAAERDGKIGPGGMIVEATAGNTGLGLALVAAQKGYRLLLVIPDKMAQEKIFHLRALGAEIYITRSDVGKGHPDYYQDLAERLAREQGGFYVNQFANPANPDAHERTTGPEILEQMGGDLDAVVVGVGSGGTLTGIGRFMKRAAPKVKMILADPQGSVLAPLLKTGTMPKPGSWVVEGIGEDFVPPNCDLSLVSEALTVTDTESLATARDLLRKEGILGGSSTGTLLAGALRWCRAQTAPKRVVTLVCDSGNKYLSKMFNDYWMIDQGFIQRERTGDLRDLITRRHAERETVTVAPDDTLMIAYSRMKLYDVSQLPVLEKGEVVGIIDESDLLLAVYDNEAAFREPVRSAMTPRLETVDSSASLESLLPIFAQGHVVIVKHEGEFAGLITRIDLINHLRRRLK